MKHYIGIDLGGTNIVSGVVDESYQILSTASTPTNLPRDAREIVKDMVLVTKEAIKKAGLTIEDITSIGIGVPGTANKESGLVEYANNLDFYNEPLLELMKEHFDKPIYFDNDANVAAYGEYLAGCGRGTKSLVMVTLGTGVGGGIVLNDRIYTGSNYAGGELGHISIKFDGKECNCGRKGCFEVYGSATALSEMTRDAMEKDPDSKMWDLCNGEKDKVEGKTVFDAINLSDGTAKEVLDNYIYYLSVGITDIINIFQPEVLCIGGGISKAGDMFLNPLKELIDKQVYTRNSANQTKIMIATLHNDAGIIGAAMLKE